LQAAQKNSFPGIHLSLSGFCVGITHCIFALAIEKRSILRKNQALKNKLPDPETRNSIPAVGALINKKRKSSFTGSKNLKRISNLGA
jgi:hypothetical protein